MNGLLIRYDINLENLERYGKQVFQPEEGTQALCGSSDRMIGYATDLQEDNTTCQVANAGDVYGKFGTATTLRITYYSNNR